ncbi:uncharacterized protein LOC144123489 isoform X2 [Amblyomma americanum]
MNGTPPSCSSPPVDNGFNASALKTTPGNHSDTSDTPTADAANMAPGQSRQDAAATSLRSGRDNAAQSIAVLDADASMTDDDSSLVAAAIPVYNPFSVLSTENVPGTNPCQLASNRTVALNSMVMRRQLDGIDENGEEDVIMYLSCGLFICNVVIDAFVVKRLSVYAAKMSSLPLPGSGSNQ